ncbi:MAG: FAD:protein FMN transferase [Candidatus Fermentibacteraceae bacterium]
MGTMASIIVYCPPDTADVLLEEAQRLVHDLDRSLSAYEDGRLGLLNELGRASLDDADLRAMVTASDSLQRITGGAFDPTTGGLVRLWGFPASPAVPAGGEIDSVLGLTGWERLVSVSSDSVVMAPGVTVDFGAAAKGYAADRAYTALMDMGASAALVEIGGEVRCGSRPGFGKVWTVGIRHPRDGGLLDTVRVEQGALATSGDYECFFIDPAGRRLSHIIDPSSGHPAQNAVSASVLARSCVVADAVATALVIGGRELADSLPEGLVRAILIVEDDDDGIRVGRRGEWQDSPNG